VAREKQNNNLSSCEHKSPSHTRRYTMKRIIGKKQFFST